jgi:hypothetical protein
MEIIKKTVYFMLFCFSINLYSQVREKKTIELTPKIGYSTYRYYASGFPSGKLNSINFGVTGDYYFNQIWSIQTGILYQKMGGKTFYDKAQIEYINLPINANWHFGSTRKWNLNFGPSLGFLTSAEANGVDNKDAVNSTQFGLNVGIGYKIEVNEKISILIDYQSLSGLNNVATDSNLTFKNTFGSFNVGGVFKL